MRRSLVALLLASAVVGGVASGALAAPRDTIENQAEATPAWIERDRRAAERGDLDAQYRLAGACRWILFAHICGRSKLLPTANSSVCRSCASPRQG